MVMWQVNLSYLTSLLAIFMVGEPEESKDRHTVYGI